MENKYDKQATQFPVQNLVTTNFYLVGAGTINFFAVT